jgi:hypothetical protein
LCGQWRARVRHAWRWLLLSRVELQRYLKQTYWTARKNAKGREIKFLLSKEEYEQIVRRANGQCEVTGITFELRVRPGSWRRPFAPSLDRIESSGIYEASNCRLICGIVNAAMSDWGDDCFWKMVLAAKRKHRGCQIEREETPSAVIADESASD